MTRWAGALAGGFAVIVAGPVADAEPQLRLTHEPPPRHLRMRPRAAAVTPPSKAPAMPMPAPPPTLSQADLNDRGAVGALRDVLAPVSFSLTIGYQVDGARPSGKASLDAPVQEGRDYSALRSYGFGELFFSTRGVALDSLSSYFSLRLDAAAHSDSYVSPEGISSQLAPPIATWFDRTTFELRTGWSEMKDFLPRNLGLRKLRLRGGSQYIYGPWVLHIDGVLLGYDGDVVTATAYAGGRHADYSTDLTKESYAVTGGSLRVDLRQLVDVPVTLTGESLGVTSGVAGQPDSTHHQFEIDWQLRRDFTVLAQARVLDGKLANERLQLRARYSDVTNLVFDVMRRFSTDWRWDPSLIAADDPTAARRYLDLGPVLPQLIVSLRGGTLIAENVDLVARTTIATDPRGTDGTKSGFSAAYVEFGGALDIRLRRTIAVGLSGLSRRTDRVALDAPITDVRLVAQPLPPSAATGEQQFTELGTRVRMSLGARRFSTMVELYGRRTRYTDVYRDPSNEIDPSDLRGGGRVTIDAWIGKQLRLFASYDVSTAIEHTPEITSYKSLRLTMTGAY